MTEVTTSGGVSELPPGTSEAVGLVIQSGEYSVIVTAEEPIAEPFATLTVTGDLNSAATEE